MRIEEPKSLSVLETKLRPFSSIGILLFIEGEKCEHNLLNTLQKLPWTFLEPTYSDRLNFLDQSNSYAAFDLRLVQLPGPVGVCASEQYPTGRISWTGWASWTCLC